MEYKFKNFYFLKIKLKILFEFKKLKFLEKNPENFLGIIKNFHHLFLFIFVKTLTT